MVLLGLAWALNILPVSASNAVREASRKVVEDCLAAVPGNKNIPVNDSWTSVCRKAGPDGKGGLNQGEESHFSLARREDGIHIGMKIRFNIQPKETKAKRAALLLEKTRACMNDLNQYWKRYAVRLDVEIDSNRSKTEGAPDYQLALSDRPGRSHSRLHYFKGLEPGPTYACFQGCLVGGTMLKTGTAACEQLCEPVRHREFCLMMLHEVGHLLGLPDEYAEPEACPDREFVSNETMPYSVMAVPMFGFLDNIQLLGNEDVLNLNAVEFFPRHLKKILKPICE